MARIGPLLPELLEVLQQLPGGVPAGVPSVRLLFVRKYLSREELGRVFLFATVKILIT